MRWYAFFLVIVVFAKMASSATAQYPYQQKLLEDHGRYLIDRSAIQNRYFHYGQSYPEDLDDFIVEEYPRYMPAVKPPPGMKLGGVHFSPWYAPPYEKPIYRYGRPMPAPPEYYYYRRTTTTTTTIIVPVRVIPVWVIEE